MEYLDFINLPGMGILGYKGLVIFGKSALMSKFINQCAFGPREGLCLLIPDHHS